MSYGWWFVVILVTSGAALLGFGWLLGRGQAELERLELLGQLDQVTANVQLPRAGYFPGPPFAGAQDAAYQVRRIAAPGAAGPPYLSPALSDGTAASPAYQPIPWDLVGAVYLLGQQRADQDAVSREVAAMIAEYDAQHGGGG